MAETPFLSRVSRKFAHPLSWAALAFVVFLANASFAVFRHSGEFIWDEGRYVEWALHFLDRDVATFDDTDFVNGPGYPLVLAPFIAAMPGLEKQMDARTPPSETLPLLLARLLNAALMGGAAAFLFLTLQHYAGPAWAAAGALWTGLHPALLWVSFGLMTEPLALFCLTGFAWSCCHALRAEPLSWKWLLAASAFLGWLTLTRVFFGHVITATCIACLLAWPVMKARRPALRRILLMLGGALLICAPYLHHTWKKTGDFPCWSTNGGELLYWSTSHNPGENGHWFSYDDAVADPNLAPNHREFFERVLKLPVLEREAAFKARAREQFELRSFARNWACNLSRLAFGFPRAFHPEELRTLAFIAFNGPLVILALIALWFSLPHWRALPPEIGLLALMAAFYIGGVSLAPGMPRYFAVITPLLWIASAAVWRRYVPIGPVEGRSNVSDL